MCNIFLASFPPLMLDIQTTNIYNLFAVLLFLSRNALHVRRLNRTDIDTRLFSQFVLPMKCTLSDAFSFYNIFATLSIILYAGWRIFDARVSVSFNIVHMLLNTTHRPGDMRLSGSSYLKALGCIVWTKLKIYIQKITLFIIEHLLLVANKSGCFIYVQRMKNVQILQIY